MNLAIIFNILAAIGGVSAVFSFFKWVKGKSARVKVISSNAEYHVFLDGLITKSKLQIANERNESVFITDIIGLVKEDPSKKKDRKGRVFAIRPSNPSFTPMKIDARSTVELGVNLHFPKVAPRPLRRLGVANLLGFLANGVPVVLAKESDFDEKWDQLPIELKLIIHVNAKTIIEELVGAYQKGATDGSCGTLNSVQIAKFQRDYAYGKNKQ